MQPEISIVIANWNGAAFLERGLQSLVDAAEEVSLPYEIIVVDDASQDHSAALIQEKFPSVRLEKNETNQRFARTANRGARLAKGRLLVMVNNDVYVPKDFLSRLTAPFHEQGGERVFAVGAQTLEWDEKTPNHTCNYPAWRRGGIGKEWGHPKTRFENCYVQGGAAAYDRTRFLEMGGFDDFFYPGYWEDYDLSWRAMRAGWRSIYEPEAVAYHLGKGSFSKIFPPKSLERLEERNRLWFIWLNLGHPFLWARHLAALPWVLGRDLVQGRAGITFPAFFRAAVAFPRLWQRRLKRPNPAFVLSEKALLFTPRSAPRE